MISEHPAARVAPVDKWTVGDPLLPKPGGAAFDNRESAINHALALHPDDVWAVWAPQDDGAELVARV